MTKPIGGYFELDLILNKHYHQNALKLNSARYCIEYILRLRKYKTIYIPFYTCDSVLQPAKKLNLDIRFYNIDKNLMPILNDSINDDSVLLFINYFGLNTDKIPNIISKYKNIIIDNTQAFFVNPINNIDTVYSPRKFFGVSDGGYLYTNIKNYLELKQDISYKRYEYLLKRIDLGPQKGYKNFCDNEDELNHQDILKMSNLTSSILSSLDYNYIKNKREENFNTLHKKLKSYNELTISDSILNNGPMIYPLLIKNRYLKDHLIKNNIFVATYWKDALSRTNDNDYEKYLINNLVPIPIDQRYNQQDMMYIIDKIMEVIK